MALGRRIRTPHTTTPSEALEPWRPAQQCGFKHVGRTHGVSRSRRISRRFRLADSAQQMVGGFLLAGPFVVTEEVWVLARGMHGIQAALTAMIVGIIGYATLYRADTDRDPGEEPAFVGVPIRFISLMVIAFGSVFVLGVLFDAPDTFLIEEGIEGLELWTTIFKATCVGAVFSVVGAATADSLF